MQVTSSYLIIHLTMLAMHTSNEQECCLASCALVMMFKTNIWLLLLYVFWLICQLNSHDKTSIACFGFKACIRLKLSNNEIKQNRASNLICSYCMLDYVIVIHDCMNFIVLLACSLWQPQKAQWRNKSCWVHTKEIDRLSLSSTRSVY